MRDHVVSKDTLRNSEESRGWEAMSVKFDTSQTKWIMWNMIPPKQNGTNEPRLSVWRLLPANRRDVWLTVQTKGSRVCEA